ncbi:Vtc2p [Sugiyamaella lignohabitans]|uniref:Vtc2p n=1 Tax=Sugiyamaella lignohabitans TaxID=796027 RepID=A0A161HMF1_9ASCO|nr:Vtc2p [Sugiyamaella lignohabitans]ANB14867.1 Vtc2p [Sugiyamaella lignohabitans]
MLFGLRLANEVYPPWKQEYISYEKLKKLLKESVISDSGEQDSSWTEQDETKFGTFLDSELEKVYSFESAKYTELSKRIADIEKTVEQAQNLDAKKVEAELEEILELASQLDRFRRVNFTGFAKIVKKHDRLHPKYKVKPLLQVRLNALPFHSEDYSPLLYRLSGLYSVLSENYGTGAYPTSASAVMSSFHRASGFKTLKFWIHPDNVMEVKTKILRHLPVLVYNSGSDNGDDDESTDPVVTSLYLDNKNFDIYDAQLEKKRDSNNDTVIPSLRLRWHGRLYENPNITLEQKYDDKVVRINLKSKHINQFLDGNASTLIERQVAKLKARNTSPAQIDAYKSAAHDLDAYIQDHQLEPMLRTVHTRTAFEIPGDDRVRIILDNDISFIKEDSLNQDSPIREPGSWHRADLDIPGIADPLKVLRKSEYSKFPYAVLEVRVKTNGKTSTGAGSAPASGSNKPYPAWIEELINGHLVTEIPNFSKFVQGVANLYTENDHVDGLPFWLPELEHDIRQDPTEVYKRNRLASSDYPKTLPSTKLLNAVQATSSNAYEPDEDSSDGGVSSGVSSAKRGSVGFPTYTHSGPKLDVDSEDEEVVLPPGVKEPSTYIKNSGAVKVETKVWLANERTFNRWLHVTTLLSALTFTLYSSVERSFSVQHAELIAYFLFALTIFSGIWGYGIYMQRLKHISARSEKHLDNVYGPLIIAFGLLAALIINFAAAFKHHRDNGLPVPIPAPSSPAPAPAPTISP